MVALDAKEIREFREKLNSWSRYSEEERDEIASRTFCRLALQENIRNPQRWFLATAKNVAKELIREETREREFRQSLRKTPNDDASKLSSDQASAFESSTAWNSLDPKHQELLWLVCVNKKGVTSAASEVGIKRSTAKSWKTRDLSKLEKDPTLRALAGISDDFHQERTKQ